MAHDANITFCIMLNIIFKSPKVPIDGVLNTLQVYGFLPSLHGHSDSCFVMEQKPHSQLWRQKLSHSVKVIDSSGM